MSGYERPTEKGQSAKKITFWATVWTPNHTSHGEAVVSPAFGTSSDLSGWVRAKRREGSQVAAWKRTSYGTDFHDEPLRASEEPKADPERLARVLAGMRSDLASKSRPAKKDRAA